MLQKEAHLRELCALELAVDQRESPALLEQGEPEPDVGTADAAVRQHHCGTADAAARQHHSLMLADDAIVVIHCRGRVLLGRNPRRLNTREQSMEQR